MLQPKIRLETIVKRALLSMCCLFYVFTVRAQDAVSEPIPAPFFSHDFEVEQGEAQKMAAPELKFLLNQAAIYNHQANYVEGEKSLLAAMNYIDKNEVSIDDAYRVLDRLMNFYDRHRMFKKEIPLIERFITPRIHFIWDGNSEQEMAAWTFMSVVPGDNLTEPNRLNRVLSFFKHVDQQLQQGKSSVMAKSSDQKIKMEWYKRDMYLIDIYVQTIKRFGYENDEAAEKLFNQLSEMMQRLGIEEGDHQRIKAMRNVADAKFEHKKYDEAKLWLDKIKATKVEYWSYDNVHHVESAADDAIFERYAQVYRARGEYDKEEQVWLDLVSQASIKPQDKNGFMPDFGLMKSLHNLKTFYQEQNQVAKSKAIDSRMRKSQTYKFFDTYCRPNQFCLTNDGGSH